MTWQRANQRSLTGYAIWRFLALWVVCMSIAGTVGLIAADLPVVGLRSVDYQQTSALVLLVIWAVGLVVVAGPLIGAAQGLLLWLFKQVDGLRALVWVTTTLPGAFLAVIAGLGLLLAGAGGGDFIRILFLGPGAMLGLAQWLLLRRIMDNAGWWIGANTLGWFVGILVGWLVFANVLPQTADWLPFYPAQVANNWTIAWAAGMLAFSSTTGVAFIWISRHQS